MEELYKAIEDKIKEAGYDGQVSGEEIYEEICDQIEGQENGTYIFMSKKEEDTFFEYTIEIMDEEFNLASIAINMPDKTIRVSL